MSDPVTEVTEDLSKAKLADEAGLYTSDSRGSDEAGEGTYKVPFKTVMKVKIIQAIIVHYKLLFRDAVQKKNLHI